MISLCRFCFRTGEHLPTCRFASSADARTQPTPGDLLEAIQNATRAERANASFLPIEPTIEKHVIDFLAQRFCAALLMAEGPEAEKRIQDLFQACTGKSSLRP